MKKLSTMIMALALVLGMSQCKKKEIPTNGNGGEKVYITLNVNNGESIAVNVDNGGRHAVAPNLGVIQFENNDVLYVGYNGHYIGQLTYQNGAFSGNLDAPTSGVDDNLHFYFLGGREPATTPTAGTTTDFTISIANQKQNQKLPVLCYGASTQYYSSTGSNYTAVLEYKCALVKFNLNKATEYDCILSNMPTEATISFATTSSNFTPIAKTSTTGTIDLYREEGNTGVRWAILLPGTNLSADGNVSGAPSGTLNANQFINSGITLTNPVFAAPDAQYAVKDKNSKMSVFSVSSTQKVYFSKANLRYDESTHVWSFHENQIDGCIGYVTGSYPQGTNVTPNGTKMDRFSWGLHGSTTTGETDWVDGSRNLNSTDGTDWGCALTGEGNNNWRTLTAAEWNYLLNNANRGSKRFMKVTIGTFNITDPNTNTTYNNLLITGLFIAPDQFDPSKYSFTSGFASKTWNNVTCQSINIADATILLEEAGCVFLPALGYRDSNGYQAYYYYSKATNYNFVGYYWSATGGEQMPNSAQTPKAEALKFDRTSNTMPSNNAQTRDLGMCVRLVWDAN